MNENVQWQMITHPQMKNPTIVMLTDRNDLDDQLFSTFSMGVPVKPIYEALGKASRKYLAFPYRISESSLVVTTRLK
jgi:type I restriction enzyme R subunit